MVDNTTTTTTTTTTNINTTTKVSRSLAHTDKRTRDKAVKVLLQYLTQTTHTKDSLLKLWKGLFYTFWMSDKQPVQMHLATNLASPLTNKLLQTSDQSILYLSTFYTTICREWYGIDRLRLDKYYMLLRTFQQASFNILLKKNHNDNDGFCIEFDSRVVELYSQNVVDVVMNGPMGLRYHFIEAFWQELDKFVTINTNTNNDNDNDQKKNGLKKVKNINCIVDIFIRLIAKHDDKPLRNAIVEVFSCDVDKRAWFNSSSCCISIQSLAKRIFGFASTSASTNGGEELIESSRRVMYQLAKSLADTLDEEIDLTTTTNTTDDDVETSVVVAEKNLEDVMQVDESPVIEKNLEDFMQVDESTIDVNKQEDDDDESGWVDIDEENQDNNNTLPIVDPTPIIISKKGKKKSRKTFKSEEQVSAIVKELQNEMIVEENDDESTFTATKRKSVSTSETPTLKKKKKSKKDLLTSTYTTSTVEAKEEDSIMMTDGNNGDKKSVRWNLEGNTLKTFNKKQSIGKTPISPSPEDLKAAIKPVDIEQVKKHIKQPGTIKKLKNLKKKGGAAAARRKVASDYF